MNLIFNLSFVQIKTHCITFVNMKHQIKILFLLVVIDGCNSSQTNSTDPALQNDSASGKPLVDSAKPDTQTVADVPFTDKTFVLNDLFLPQNSDVVNSLADENYKLAANKAEKYLAGGKVSLTETQLAGMRYMYIYSLCALVIQKNKSRDDLRTILDSYKGKGIITQHLPITEGIGTPFNQIQVEQVKKGTIRVTCTDNAGLHIHCFVSAELTVPFDLKKNLGKRAYLCGTLSEYWISAGDINSWVADLKLKNGFVKILERE